MSKTRLDVTIKQPADIVWSTIRDFGDVSWRGGMGECSVLGRVRTVRALDVDVEVEELEVDRDEYRRTYAYRVTGMRGHTSIDVGDGTTINLASMVNHHTARLTVLSSGQNTSRVVYDLELDDGHDETMSSTAGQYRRVLDWLKLTLESYHSI